MSYKLQKPFTTKQRADFVVEYNHKNGLTIEETDTALYALEAYEKLVDGEVVDNSKEYEAQQEEQENARIAMLKLTAADVERAIYKAKGMDFDDVLAFVAANPPENLDIKALRIELKANLFYRGNPYIDAVGKILGFTPEMLNEFFETNDYTKLLPAEPAAPEAEPAPALDTTEESEA